VADKLTPELAWRRAEQLIERNADRNALYDRLDKLYFQEHADTTDNPAVQRIHMPYATAVIDLISDLAALMDIHIEVPAASESAPAQRDADDIEKWLRAWLSLNQRAQQANLIGEAAWLAAQRSMLVMRTLFIESAVKQDKDDDNYSVSGVPVVLQVRDPRNVYVASGASGMRYVVESYTRLAGDVRELYPDALDDDIPDEHEVTWAEYWDCDHRIYFVDGEPVRVAGKEVALHGYGCIPYAIGHGRTTPFKTSQRRYRPVLAGVEDTANSIDVAFSIMGTASLNGAVSAWNIFADAERDLDMSPGAVNQFRKDERVEALQRAVLPPDFFQFLTLLLQAWQANTVPFNLFGQSPGDLAGYAISLLSQAGRRVMGPIWKAVQDCLASAMRNTLTICRNKVAPLTGERIPLVVIVAGETRKVKREIKLDTSKIGDDFDLTVTLDDPMPSDEAANIRMAIETTKGSLLSQQTALTKFKIVPDGLAEMDRIAAETIYKQLMPYEGAKLALERGYLPKDMTPPPGWVVMPNGMILPQELVPQPQPQPQPGAAQPGPSAELPPMGMAEMGANPADMQGLAAGTPPPGLSELAGAPPPMPMLPGA